LIEKLQLKVLTTQFTLISSPPSTGKSSLLKLFLNKYKYPFKFVQCVDNMDPFELFKKATGIDLASEKIDDTIPKGTRTMVIIDDAHCFYGNQLFWTSLLKHLPSWIDANYRVSFIVSATHNISFFSSSPEGFNAIPKISNEDLKLSIKESYEAIELTFRKKFFSLSNIVKDFIVNQCGGVIGAVVLSVVMIADKFAQHIPTETDILHYLCSGDFMNFLSRVFGTFRGRVLPEFQVFLSDFMMGSLESVNDTSEHEVQVIALEKMGVLVRDQKGVVSFASPLANRYYTHFLFPNRPIECPQTIEELVAITIGNMSSTLLTKSTHSSRFPKETIFQHEFMSGLAKSLPVEHHICPELSHIFPSTRGGAASLPSSETVEGAIDFYINGELHWGLELLVNGDRVKEHLNRFETDGKYFPFGMSDYRVIDFRLGDPTKSKIVLCEKRITVFFQQNDFTTCTCMFGTTPEKRQINLLP
jgi:hypothetical protein